MGLHTAYVEAEIRIGKLIREAEYRFFYLKIKNDIYKYIPNIYYLVYL